MLLGKVAVPPPPPSNRVLPKLRPLGHIRLSELFLDRHRSALLALFLQHLLSIEANLVAPVVEGLAVELMKVGAVILELERIGRVDTIVVLWRFFKTVIERRINHQ